MIGDKCQACGGSVDVGQCRNEGCDLFGKRLYPRGATTDDVEAEIARFLSRPAASRVTPASGPADGDLSTLDRMHCSCGSDRFMRFGPYGAPGHAEPEDVGLKLIYTCSGCGEQLRVYQTSDAWRASREGSRMFERYKASMQELYKAVPFTPDPGEPERFDYARQHGGISDEFKPGDRVIAIADIDYSNGRTTGHWLRKGSLGTVQPGSSFDKSVPPVIDGSVCVGWDTRLGKAEASGGGIWTRTKYLGPAVGGPPVDASERMNSEPAPPQVVVEDAQGDEARAVRELDDAAAKAAHAASLLEAVDASQWNVQRVRGEPESGAVSPYADDDPVVLLYAEEWEALKVALKAWDEKSRAFLAFVQERQASRKGPAQP